MESVPEEIVRDILLKLPTRGVASCRCVCKPWHRLLTNLSFCRLHANATHVGAGAAEALLVSQRRPPGETTETTVFSVSSAKPMCRVVELAEGYHVASVCNGFIVLAPGKKKEFGTSWDPVFVCNPVTREKFQVPVPPGLTNGGRHLFSMGLCPSVHQYKLFRLPFHESSTDGNYLDVYMFGGSGWRRHRNLYRRHVVRTAGSPPVLIGGKIYILTKHEEYGCTPDNILVIDVASEAYRTYRLMPYQGSSVAAMELFELGGQPCVAEYLDQRDRGKLHLWVMSTPQLVQGGQQQQEKKFCENWDLRYTFYHDLPIGCCRDNAQRGAWVEDDGILCCVIGDQFYRYDTTKNDKKHFLAWDHKLRLPSPPPTRFNRLRCIFGGYRPTLLSPRDLHRSDTTNNDNKHTDEEDFGGRSLAWDHKLRLPSPPTGFSRLRVMDGGYRPTLLSSQQHDNVDMQFEHDWLHALRCHKSSNECPDNGIDQHAA